MSSNELTIEFPALDLAARVKVRRQCYESSLYCTKTLYKAQHGRRFRVAEHNVKIAEVMDRVFRGELTRVIINVPPRYGKTEQVIKQGIAQGLAYNAGAKFLHLSYSDDLALDNSNEVREIVKNPAYQILFPHVNVRENSDSKKKWYTTEGGGVYATSAGGQVTGFGAGQVEQGEEENEEEEIDIFLKSIEDLAAHRPPFHAGGIGWQNPGKDFAGAIMIDDPIKPEDADNELARSKVNKRFNTTIRSRANARNTPIVIVMQRLHEEDLAGFVQELEPGVWFVLSLPALRSDGTALDPIRHTPQELRRLRELDETTFERQMQQNPMPLTGLMYHEFQTYAPGAIPAGIQAKAMVDVADTGEDFLCAVAYKPTEVGAYVVGVVYTQARAEVTELLVASLCSDHLVKLCRCESNNGGQFFKRNVEALCRKAKNFFTTFKTFVQRKNKESRILNNSSAVNNYWLMPEDWAKRWPDFYKALTRHLKAGKNEHDDAPDCLTAAFEHEEIRSQKGYKKRN